MPNNDERQAITARSKTESILQTVAGLTKACFALSYEVFWWMSWLHSVASGVLRERWHLGKCLRGYGQRRHRGIRKALGRHWPIHHDVECRSRSLHCPLWVGDDLCRRLSTALPLLINVRYLATAEITVYGLRGVRQTQPACQVRWLLLACTNWQAKERWFTKMRFIWNLAWIWACASKFRFCTTEVLLLWWAVYDSMGVPPSNGDTSHGKPDISQPVIVHKAKNISQLIIGSSMIEDKLSRTGLQLFDHVRTSYDVIPAYCN